MFSARDLLGQVMQTAMNDTTASRVRHALGPQGLGAEGGPLARLLGQGGGRGGLLDGAGGLLGDAGRAVQGGNPLAVGGLGALAGAVLGGGGGALRGALGGGVLALLGGLALSALGKRDEPAPAAAEPAPLGVREPQNLDEEAELERRARLVLQAMISAAKADGQIDGGEIQRIVGKLEQDGAGAEARGFVLEEMRRPQDLDALLREVDSKETAVEVYGASLLAIEIDTPAERAYLGALAGRLGLDDEAVRRIHQALGAPPGA